MFKLDFRIVTENILFFFRKKMSGVPANIFKLLKIVCLYKYM